jgi:Flp pilus assembly protein TadD
MQSFQNIDAEKLHKVVSQLIQQNNFREAIQGCQALNSNHPSFAEGWFLTSLVAIKINNLPLSLQAINEAINLKSSNYRYLLHKIHLLQHSGNQEKSIELTLQMSELNISESAVLEELAFLLSKTQHINKAKQLFEKALKLKPNSDSLYHNIAAMQNFLGEINDAITSCNLALKINPHNYSVLFLRSELSKNLLTSNHIPELESLIKDGIKDPIGHSQVCFALAKEYEDCKNYAASFRVRKQGAAIYRKNMSYDLDSDISFNKKLIETYDKKSIINSSDGYNSNAPIFILGLPRSGSTLVERILSSHSKVSSAGELTNFTHQMIGLMEQLPVINNPSRDDMVAASSQLNFNQLGSAYIKSTASLAGQKQHFIDKFPQNALYAGLIHKALPKARIILVERNPLDVCYAMYKQLFTEIYQFSYDLDELARYYISHHKLMTHWKNVMPDIVHVVRYEQLVDDIETTTKDLLAHCNLSWEPQCLDFHKNKQASMTASASQVRQKLYRTSIGMWRNYENELQPLISKLDKAGLLTNLLT